MKTKTPAPVRAAFSAASSVNLLPMSMGVEISDQLAMFLRSVLLGGLLGLVYDLLRALRVLGGRWWGGVLDSLYCLITVSALFFFVMAGDGELRLFFLAGALGGAVLFFCVLSQTLRPLWDFWLQILLSPVRLAGAAVKKCWHTTKIFFFRGKNCVIIRAVQCRRMLRDLVKPAEGDDGDREADETDPEG